MSWPTGEEWKLRGHIRLALMRHLAEGNYSHTKLAEMYDVSRAGIDQFANRNRDEIAEIKADFENEFAGMWIARKKDRIAAYAEDVKLVEAAIETAHTAHAADPLQLVGLLPGLVRVKQNALKAAAEEMGQLAARIQVNVEPVKVDYTITGSDTSEI